MITSIVIQDRLSESLESNVQRCKGSRACLHLQLCRITHGSLDVLCALMLPYLCSSFFIHENLLHDSLFLNVQFFKLIILCYSRKIVLNDTLCKTQCMLQIPLTLKNSKALLHFFVD